MEKIIGINPVIEFLMNFLMIKIKNIRVNKRIEIEKRVLFDTRINVSIVTSKVILI